MRGMGFAGTIVATAALALAGACGGEGGRDNDNPVTTLTITAGGTGDADSGGDNGEAEFIFLEVMPKDLVLEVDLDTPTTQDYTVLAHYTGGVSMDVTDTVTWEVSNPMVGGMNGATFEVTPQPMSFFATTLLTATFEDEEGPEQGQAQLTIAVYRKTGDITDFFFLLPFEDPGGGQTKPLSFNTAVKSIDVFFNMDNTGSMAGPINNLKSALQTTIIPNIQMQVPDTQFGAGAFDDYPLSPFGDPGCGGGADQPFTLLQGITGDPLLVQAAVNLYAANCGADGHESNIEALYQIATGEGLLNPAPTNVPPNMAGVGGVGFREGSFPVIVSITDAPSHDIDNESCEFGPGYSTNAGVAAVAHGMAATTDALNAICARVVQIATNSTPTCSALADGRALANATSALIPPDAWDLAPAGRPGGCAAGMCCTGQDGAGVAPDPSGLCPSAYEASAAGTGVSAAASDGIQMLAQYSPFEVTTRVNGVDTDVDGNTIPGGFTTADFIKSIVPLEHGPVPLPGVPDPTLTPDSFLGVIPETPVTFEVTAFNDFFEPPVEATLFTANISVLADACSDLDERDVFILVPPAELPPPG